MIILLILLDAIVVRGRRKGILTKEKRDQIKAKKKGKKFNEEERGIAIPFIIMAIYTVIAIPYFMYQVFANPSVVTIGIVVCNVIFSLVKEERVKKLCDIVNLALMIALGFILYS